MEDAGKLGQRLRDGLGPQDPVQNTGGERDPAKPATKPNCQHEHQNHDDAANHVVPELKGGVDECRRGGGDRPFQAGNHCASGNSNEREKRDENGETMQPRVLSHVEFLLSSAPPRRQ